LLLSENCNQQILRDKMHAVTSELQENRSLIASYDVEQLNTVALVVWFNHRKFGQRKS
jgi:hypothetical protein